MAEILKKTVTKINKCLLKSERLFSGFEGKQRLCAFDILHTIPITHLVVVAASDNFVSNVLTLAISLRN